MMRDQFEQDLRESLEGYSMRPSEGIWKNIERQLLLARKSASFHWKNWMMLVACCCIWLSTADKYNAIFVLPSESNNNLNITPSTSGQKLSLNDKRKEIRNEVMLSHIGNPNIQAPFRLGVSNTSSSITESLTKEPKLYTITEHLQVEERIKKPVISKMNFHQVPADKFTPLKSMSTEKRPTFMDEYLEQITAAEPGVKSRKKALALYITPSVSYRTLNSNHRVSFGNLTPSDPENYVAHRPGIGLEVGIASIRTIHNRIQIRSGLQFNYTRYSATASQGFPEVSTITFNTLNRIQRISNLRTSSDEYKRSLPNESFQLSIPVGMQYKILERSGLDLMVGVSMQPTWVIHATSFLISTDYRNYVKAPELLRPLNLYTGTELLFTRTKGNYQFQAGPQIRYQVLSNYISEYPIREHLIDYGLRVGFIRKL